MKKLVILAGVAMAVLVAGPAIAENAQQAKMKACNAEASEKALSGEARKTFMSTCLSAASPQKKQLTAQQQKMKSCNAEASKEKLKGQPRKDFLSKCLSSS